MNVSSCVVDTEQESSKGYLGKHMSMSAVTGLCLLCVMSGGHDITLLCTVLPADGSQEVLLPSP